MRAICNYVLASALALWAFAARASEQAVELAPEPTVGVVWVGAFVALFFGLCAWFVILMIRNERRNRAAENEAK
jgi:hypothetical protein